MVKSERAYDFNEFGSTANTLNQLSWIEYGKNGLKFGRMHNKMTIMWVQLRPLGDDDDPCDLGDCSSIVYDVDVVTALKESIE